MTAIINRRTFVRTATTAMLASATAPLRAAPGLAGDVAILREAITTLHPGLYRYLSPREAERELARLDREFVAAPDMAGQFLALSRFLAKIRCGHSHANFFNQKKAVAAALFDRPTRLPFAFRWLGAKMIVTADHGGGVALLPGSEVLSINDVRAAAMLAGLMPYARADGSNDAKRRIQLSVTGADEIEYFDIFHGLVFGAPVGGVHRVVIRQPDGERRELALPPITLTQRQSFRAQTPEGDELGWSWRIRDDGVALLTMPSWVTYNSKWDWRGWLRARLDSLAAAKGLIVDLRDNEGGTDCGDDIIARFLRADLPAVEELRLVRYRTTPTSLDPWLDTWDDSFRTLGVGAERHDDRFFRLPAEADQTISARGPRLALPLAVLIGAQNSSATFRFAQRCRGARIATLIGETTGGNQRGINGGRYFFVRLPASGLEFDLPLIGYFPRRAMPDAGLTPDIAAPQTARDIAQGRDAGMEAAVRHITGATRRAAI